jgi:type IV secretory pathway VirB4 component
MDPKRNRDFIAEWVSRILESVENEVESRQLLPEEANALRGILKREIAVRLSRVSIRISKTGAVIIDDSLQVGGSCLRKWRPTSLTKKR